MRNPLFKKADDPAFYRGNKFRKEPAVMEELPPFDEIHYIHYPDDNTFNVVLFNDGKGMWSKVVDDAKLESIVGDTADTLRAGEGQEIHPPNVIGQEVPFKAVTVHSKQISKEDEQFMKDMRISGNLRKSVKAAYMNGYAEHAAKWLRQHGNATRGSEQYAEQNGLRPEYFKEAIHTMSRYARATSKLAAVCPKCNLPTRENEILNRTSEGESHITCPHTASKIAAQYIDDEWREVLSANGWNPRAVMEDGKELERWIRQGFDFNILIDHDESGEPYFTVWKNDGEYVSEGKDTWSLEIFTSDDVVLQSTEPVKHDKAPNEDDKKWLKGLGIEARKKLAADPKWVGLMTPPKSKQHKKWDMGGPLEKKQPSVLPYAGNNPFNPRNTRPRLEPPVKDTPEFAKAVSNLMILHKKKAIGDTFAIMFPEPMLEVAPEVIKEFRSDLKKWMQFKQWQDQFKITLEDGVLMVQRVKAPWESDQPTPRGLGETDEYLDEKIEDLIQVPAEWLHRLMPKTSAEHERHSFIVPMASAAHVAHHLASAGLLDFEVETDEDTEESYFSFNTNDELEAAHEIVRHAFHHQIEAGKGQWAEWKQLEPADSMMDKPKARAMASAEHHAMTEKQAGAWGERSYDNDSVHDILDQYRPKGNKGRGFEEPIPAESVQPLLDEMLTMVDNAHTPNEQAHFFGVMVFLATHGVKLDSTFKWLAIEVGRELAGNENYLNEWKDPMARKVQLKKELKLFGNPMSMAAAEAESPYQEINDPVCLCGHTFHDHEHDCDHCDCIGFDPASTQKQVEYVCEHRSFGRVGKGSNPMTFERDKNERILKVYLDGNRVSKAEFMGRKGDKPDVRKGWDGFFSFTQTFGD